MIQTQYIILEKRLKNLLREMVVKMGVEEETIKQKGIM